MVEGKIYQGFVSWLKVLDRKKNVNGHLDAKA